MKQEYEDAKLLHDHLAKIAFLQKDISHLSRNRFAEIQGYTRPPDTLQKLMKLIFILLGEHSSDLVSVIYLILRSYPAVEFRCR